MVTNIIMLAKDRPRLTIQAIDSLFRNTKNELYNLTVIDDQSKITPPRSIESNAPALVETLTGCTNACSLRIGHSKGITGQARNLGIYWAEKYWGRGDWLYLTDNDVYFTPGWLERLTKTLRTFEVAEAGISLLGGWNHPYLQPKEGTGDRVIPWAKFHDGQVVQLHDAVTGASQLMRWETWDAYGPLDAHAVGVGQSEDWAMCQKIIKDGGRVGSIYPRVVLNCGLTNSQGGRSPGADVMLAELQDAKRTYPDLYWE